MSPTEEILLKEMRYIASISTGQVKRVAESALSAVSATGAQQVVVPAWTAERIDAFEIRVKSPEG